MIMRILCLFPVLRHANAELTFTGAERQFIEICKRWIELGSDVDIVGTYFSIKLCETFGLKADETYACEPTFFRFIGAESFVDIHKICKLIPSKKYDFIYCPNEPFEYVACSVIAKKKLKLPLIASVNLFHPRDVTVWETVKMAIEYAPYRGVKVHLKSIPQRLLFAFKKRVRVSFLKKADLIFAISKYVKDLLLKVGIDKGRIYETSSGIAYYDIRNIAPFNSKKFDACFLGAIIPRKGILDLIRAWVKIVKVKPEAKLVIIGHGTGYYRKKVEKFILDHNLQNNVIMTGFVTEERKYALLKQSRIFVFPSYLESFAQVVWEAMACGLPIIAYKLPVYEEFCGNNIIYVNIGDIEGLAIKILELLRDDALQEKMRRVGYKIAEKYDWDNVARRQFEIIRRYLRS